MKILFVVGSLEMGGITSSLISIVKELVAKNHIVSIYSILGGNIPSEIKNVELLQSNYEFTFTHWKDRQKLSIKNRIALFISLLFHKVGLHKLANKFSNSSIHQKKLKNFDCVIAYGQFEHVVNFCIKSVKTPKLIMVNHGDIRFSNFKSKKYFKKLSKFDRIYCVSRACVDSLKSEMKKYGVEYDNYDYIYNPLYVNKIKEFSTEKSPIHTKENSINAIFVGRLHEEKGISRLIESIKHINNNNFYLHIVGSGPDEEKFKNLVNENDLNAYIKFYGMQENPFSFIKSCDFLILPSYHESAGLVIIEAFLCGKPVLATRTIATDEFIKDNIGWVCENTKEDLIFQLNDIIKNPNQISIKACNLKNYVYEYKNHLDRMIKYIEE